MYMHISDYLITGHTWTTASITRGGDGVRSLAPDDAVDECEDCLLSLAAVGAGALTYWNTVIQYNDYYQNFDQNKSLSILHQYFV